MSSDSLVDTPTTAVSGVDARRAARRSCFARAFSCFCCWMLRLPTVVRGRVIDMLRYGWGPLLHNWLPHVWLQHRERNPFVTHPFRCDWPAVFDKPHGR